jgi:dolichyl-diphosphooligosaccharide--protein glycosyltransferase
MPAPAQRRGGAAERLTGWLWPLAAMVVVCWVRTAPLGLGHLDRAARDELTFTTADGREFPYLAGFDSYHWLRSARTLLRTGTTCDAVIDGVCRDTFTLAPVGAPKDYPHSVHVYAIAAVHRLVTSFDPIYPLSSSALLVPLVAGTLGILPAFAIGRRLAGAVGGFGAALAVGLNPVFLSRSARSDNDVWNVILPLLMIWAIGGAVRAATLARRLAWSVAAVLVTVLHAMTWRGWVITGAVVPAGLAAGLLVGIVGAFRSGERVWRDAGVRRLAFALGCLAGVLLLVVLASGGGIGRVRAALDAMRQRAVAAAARDWPDAFATVGELRRPALAEIAALSGGRAVCFAAWLGLVLLFLPARSWQPRHFIVLLGGTVLFWHLLISPSPSRASLLLLLALSLTAALWVAAVDRRLARGTPPEALLIVVWAVASLALAFEGVRYALLLTAPFGIAVGVAAGRLSEWLVRAAHGRMPESVIALLPAMVGAGLLVPLVARGSQAAASVVPRVNDAWAETLTAVRDQAPRESVLHVWWPYGFLAAYLAERPVSIDGASLPTHAPYWVARALLAPSERETLGLLRMLGCGSDATPHDEKHRGALYGMTSRGIDPVAAPAMIVDLANLTREEARAYLAAHRLTASLLETTHCHAPPSYVILSDELLWSSGWRQIGSWDFQRRAASESPETLLSRAWVDCRADGPAPARRRRCPLRLRLDSSGVEVDAFTYDPNIPRRGELHWRSSADGAERQASPAEIGVAGEGGVKWTEGWDPLDARVAVLIDAGRHRILVGTPGMLRSTFVQLLFLDGRYTPHLTLVADRRIGHERVAAWRVDW